MKFWADTPRGVKILAGLALLLHAINLAWVLRASAGLAVPLYQMPDTGSYLACADALRQGVPFSPAFVERILVPVLLYLVQALGGSPTTFLWLVVALHGPCVVAAYALGRDVTGSSRSAVLAAALYAFWPNLYQYGTEIGTDVLHAQLALLAVAATVRWTRQGGRGLLTAAAALWVAAQLTRPTFFFVLPVLAVLLWPARRVRAGLLGSAVLLAATLAAPAALTIHNFRVFGIAAPSLNEPEMLRRVIIPRINAFMRNAESPGRMTALFSEERDVRALEDPDYAALEFYRIGARDREAFRRHYRAVVERSRAYIDQHREWLYRSSHVGVAQQILLPPDFFTARVSGEAARAAVDVWAGRLHKALLVLLAAGLVILLRRDPSYALFTAGVAAMVLLPVVIYLWVPVRGRLPIEMAALPVLALALRSPAAWCALVGFLALGYAPVRLFHLPAAWMLGAAALVLIALAYRVFRSGVATAGRDGST